MTKSSGQQYRQHVGKGGGHMVRKNDGKLKELLNFDVVGNKVREVKNVYHAQGDPLSKIAAGHFIVEVNGLTTSDGKNNARDRIVEALSHASVDEISIKLQRPKPENLDLSREQKVLKKNISEKEGQLQKVRDDILKLTGGAEENASASDKEKLIHVESLALEVMNVCHERIAELERFGIWLDLKDNPPTLKNNNPVGVEYWELERVAL